MQLHELCDWLLTESLKAEIDTIIQLTVASEITNLSPAILTEETDIDWHRLILAGSILAKSNARKHQEAALRIATAAVTLSVNENVKDAGLTLFEKLSNHRAVKLAEKRELIADSAHSRLGVSMRIEACRRQFEDAILIESKGEWIDVNKFQSKFWSEASTLKAWLSASAPTASGKTFLVLTWLIEKMLSEENWSAVYLAPTRALVTEIEASLLSLTRNHEKIEVTSLPLAEKYFSAKSGKAKTVFVLTQERLHLLANSLQDELSIDLLIVDEAHKVGDSQRGVILQDAVERLSRINPNIGAVFVSPATQNPEELLQDAPEGLQRLSIESENPTVIQNVILAQHVPRKPKEWSLSVINGDDELSVGVLNLPSRPAGLRKRLAFIAAAAGAKGGTLVYCNGAAEAEGVATLISQLMPKMDEIDAELRDLADLSRKGVHRKYLLAPLVEQGVAFHYGNMPSLIRLEIERLFRDGKIKFLACTSTLIEGVNLSCRTIVMRGPRKGRGNPMEAHDFWNLAGRAGRWGNEFQGNIICVDPHDEQAWPIGVPQRSRYPIRRETDAVIEDSPDLAEYIERRITESEIEPDSSAKLEQVGAFLLNTYRREGGLAGAALAKRHSKEVIERLDAAIKRVAETIEIPREVAEKHPGISAIGLQRLSEHFKSYKGNVENLLLAPSESDDAYDRFATIMRRINKFVFPAFMPDGLVPLHALIVLEWLRGLSLSAIIRKRIEYQESRGREIRLPTLIRETMDIVEQTARFKAPKYITAYVDILHSHLEAMDRNDLIDHEIDIGVSLEFGVSSKTLMSLMELGLSRMSAVSLYEKIARDDLGVVDCRAWIEERAPQFVGMDIPTVIVREINQKVGVKTELEE